MIPSTLTPIHRRVENNYAASFQVQLPLVSGFLGFVAFLGTTYPCSIDNDRGSLDSAKQNPRLRPATSRFRSLGTRISAVGVHLGFLSSSPDRRIYANPETGAASW